MRKEGHVLRTIFLMMLFQPDAPAQTKDAAVYVATYIDVQVSSTEQGTTLIRQYREASRMEPGISSIEVVQGIARPNQFVIIESWKDQSSFDAHERASHTVQFRDRLKAIHNSPFDQRVHRGFSVDQRPPAGRIAVIAVTHVDVPPPRTNETELLLKSLADESRKDDGNTRYEVFQQSASRNHFTIVAAWRDRKTFDSYETKPHTRQSREALAPMLGAPYDERLYAPLNGVELESAARSRASMPVAGRNRHKANERPQQFTLDEEIYEIAAVLDQGYEPSAISFKVQSTEGKTYLLHYDEDTDEWTLQSGFDGEGTAGMTEHRNDYSRCGRNPSSGKRNRILRALQSGWRGGLA